MGGLLWATGGRHGHSRPSPRKPVPLSSGRGPPCPPSPGSWISLLTPGGLGASKMGMGGLVLSWRKLSNFSMCAERGGCTEGGNQQGGWVGRPLTSPSSVAHGHERPSVGTARGLTRRLGHSLWMADSQAWLTSW